MRHEPEDRAVAHGELVGKGWAFDVMLTGRGTSWQGTARMPEGARTGVYVQGPTREAVEEALIAASWRLAGAADGVTAPAAPEGNGRPQG